MPAPIQIDFRIGGIADVEKAFRTVEQSVVRLEQSSARRVRTMSSDAEKTAAAEIKAEQRAAAERIKERAKADKEAEALRARAAKASIKQFEDELKAYERTEKAKLKETQAWARQREIIQTNAAKLAYKLAEEEVRAAEMAARKSAEVRERWARGVGNTTLGSFSKIASAATMLGGAAMALGGGYGISDIVQKQFAAQKTAALLVNAVTSNGKTPEGATVNNIMAKAGEVSIATGMSKDDVLKGTLAYARSARGGDFNGAMANMAFFAKLSKATGASMDDIASSAGMLQSQNADLGKDPAKMQQMMLNAYAQSKSGSVSLTDAAKQFGTLGSTRGYYSGDEAKTQQTLLGLGQIAASGGNVGDVGTYVKDLSIQAASHRKELAAMGVSFNKQGQMDSPEQMIAQVFKGTGGDLSKIEKIFGSRGMPIFTELQKSYTSAGGGEKGMAAVQSQINSVTGSTMSMEDLDKQLATTMDTTGERFNVATLKLQQVLEAKLTPYIEKFADALPELIPKVEATIDAFAKLASMVIDHPIAGIGAIIIAKVAADVAAAQIGNAVRSIITGALGGGGGTGGGVPGQAGNALAVVGAGAAGVGIGMAAVDSYFADDKQSADSIRNDYVNASQLADRIKSGKASPMDLQNAQVLLGRLNEDKDNPSGEKGLSAVTGTAIRAIGSITGNDMNAEKDKQDQRVVKELDDSIRKLTAAMNAAKVDGPTRSQPMSALARGGTQ